MARFPSRIIRRLLGFSTLGCVFALSASATSFIEKPFPETVQAAEAIVRGKVGLTYTDWGQEPGDERRIFTFVEVTVDESLKGNLPVGRALIARELGGEKDGVGMKVHGSATFARGEDVVVFLRTPPNRDGSYSLKGLMMGKLQVAVDSQGEEILQGPALGLSKGQSDPNGSKWTLSRLRHTIAEQGSGGGGMGAQGSGKTGHSGSGVGGGTGEPRSAPALHKSEGVGGDSRADANRGPTLGSEPGNSPDSSGSLGRIALGLILAGLAWGWALALKPHSGPSD
jgi:hypothetical protein